MYREYKEQATNSENEAEPHREPMKTLHEAASEGDVTSLRTLLSHGAINDRDPGGRTALYRAAEEGQTAALTLLLKSGAHVNARKRKRWTPLHIAVKNGHKAVVETLLEHGADINRQTNRQMTALMLAGKHCKEDVAQCLLEKEADIHIVDMFERSTLQWAIKGGSKNIVSRLVQSGADLNSGDQFMKTPLIQSAKSNRPDILQYLLTKGVDCSLEESYYRAAIHMAASKGRPECLQILVDHGIPVDARASNGRTPLQIAAKECWYAATKVLLENGANPTLADGFGTTPLHELAFNSFRQTLRGCRDKPYFDTALLLIDANANLDAISSANMFWRSNTTIPNQTPLEVATKAGRCFPLIKLLACAGSKPNNILDFCDLEPKDLTPLLRQNPQILEWLKSYFASPRALKELCRKLIRGCIGSDFQKKLSALDVAPGLQDYLHFNDLQALRDEHSFLTSDEQDPDEYELDRNSESEYNPSVFESEYGDDPNIVDTDDES